MKCSFYTGTPALSLLNGPTPTPEAISAPLSDVLNEAASSQNRGSVSKRSSSSAEMGEDTPHSEKNYSLKRLCSQKYSWRVASFEMSRKCIPTRKDHSYFRKTKHCYIKTEPEFIFQISNFLSERTDNYCLSKCYYVYYFIGSGFILSLERLPEELFAFVLF